MAGTLIYVEFYDHYSLSADWFYEDDVGNPRVIRGVGFLLKETPEIIFLTSVHDETSCLYSGGIAVMKKCIKTIRKIDLNDINSSSEYINQKPSKKSK